MKVVGIDHGTARIGIAISDDHGEFARANNVIELGAKDKPWEKVANSIKDLKPDLIVVGLPIGMELKPTQQSKKVELFIKQLGKLVDPIKIISWNETYSSHDAALVMRTKSKKRGRSIDAEAARIILQSYLDFKQTGI